MKISFELKKQTVIDYLEGYESFKSIGNRLGIHKKSIQTWVALYKAHGEEGLSPRYTNYSSEFKMDVLNYITR